MTEPSLHNLASRIVRYLNKLTIYKYQALLRKHQFAVTRFLSFGI